jgi:hypothetical protein
MFFVRTGDRHALAWVWLRPAARQAYERAKAEWEPERAVLNERLQNKEQQYKELQAALDDARQKLADTFKALSAEALQSNNQAFLDLAKSDPGTYAGKPPAAIWNCASRPLPTWCGRCANRSKRSTARYGSWRPRAPGLMRDCPSRSARCSKPKPSSVPKPAGWRPPCARPAYAAGGAKSSSNAWSRWRACWSTATSTPSQ